MAMNKLCQNPTSAHVSFTLAHNNTPSLIYHHKCDFGYRIENTFTTDEVVCIPQGNTVRWENIDGTATDIPTCSFDPKITVGVSVAAPLLVVLVVVAWLYHREKKIYYQQIHKQKHHKRLSHSNSSRHDNDYRETERTSASYLSPPNRKELGVYDGYGPPVSPWRLRKNPAYIPEESRPIEQVGRNVSTASVADYSVPVFNFPDEESSSQSFYI